MGAVLVSYKERSSGKLLSCGYNGFAPGVNDSSERLNNREQRLLYTVHAEVNACISAGHEARGSTLYVYPSFSVPAICSECCKVAITAGVTRIIGYLADETSERAMRWKDSIAISRIMCDEAGIEYLGLKE